MPGTGKRNCSRKTGGPATDDGKAFSVFPHPCLPVSTHSAGISR
jgi:hypothetical protein